MYIFLNGNSKHLCCEVKNSSRFFSALGMSSTPNPLNAKIMFFWQMSPRTTTRDNGPETLCRQKRQVAIAKKIKNIIYALFARRPVQRTSHLSIIYASFLSISQNGGLYFEVKFTLQEPIFQDF